MEKQGIVKDGITPDCTSNDQVKKTPKQLDESHISRTLIKVAESNMEKDKKPTRG